MAYSIYFLKIQLILEQFQMSVDEVRYVKTDGTLWTWGKNNNGQLGLGNTTYAFSSPQQVGSLTSWKNVALGTTFSIATSL